ncbi:hypothetical protein ACWOAH_09795 [Vagococcus vulneris]|uniref:Uncharacterized protein n=1 Tax=Vagococcus vulneris TaxID=1977869 RepID=A0A429ZWV6_9ENTE|nr:hypothetical protein [Vagococcus vulneris]RST98291.1 hypothetical protein CBF37_08245 [Vagococcus vulneris]
MSEKNNEAILLNVLKKSLSEIPVLDSSVDYWLVRAKSGQFYTDFNINDYVGIGWNEITLDDIKKTNNSSEQLKNILKEKLIVHTDVPIEDNSSPLDDFLDLEENQEEKKTILSEKQYGTWAGQLLRFVNNLKINDIVVVPSENSEFLLVGKIIDDIYELTDDQLLEQELTTNYKKSQFKKRWPVKWFGYFDRNEADSKLYKMIYAQATLSNINDYKPFINRAIFPYYIQDEQLFISMRVTQPNDIDSEYLGQFIYQYSLLNKSVDDNSKVISKVNVQSEGIIELISNIAPAGLISFALLSGILVAPYGGELKFFGSSIKIPGFLNGYQNNKNKKLENTSKELENLKKASDLAKELKVPISELGIKLPQKLINTIEKNMEEEVKKDSLSEKDSSNKDENSDKES